MLKKLRERLAERMVVGLFTLVLAFLLNQTVNLLVEVSAMKGPLNMLGQKVDQLTQEVDLLNTRVWSLEKPGPEVAVGNKVETQTRDRTFEFGRRNDHCQGTVDVRWHVKAAEGWDIDVASIKVEPPNATSKSNFDGVADPTKADFYLTGRVTNSGMCVKVLGEVIARDARGALNVKGTYRETRLVPAQGG